MIDTVPFLEGRVRDGIRAMTLRGEGEKEEEAYKNIVGSSSGVRSGELT